MTKGFVRRTKTVGSGTAQVSETKQDTVMIGANEVQHHDGTYALDVNPANLTNHGMRANHFLSRRYVVAANQWVDDISIRPIVPFRSYHRIRNVATGVVTPSTAILDLANGTGTNAAGDCCIITWVHVGDSLNDNVGEVTLWLRRTAVGGSGNSTIRVALANVTAVANPATGAFNALGAALHNAVPLALDVPNYFTAALAYAEFPCVAVPAGGVGAPIEFLLQYNAAAIQAAPLVAGQVYALIVYLNQDAGGDTDTFEVFGSELAAHDPTSECYFGAAGWNGVVAADATMLSPYMILSRVAESVVNQIHVYADAAQVLGDCQLNIAAVIPDADAVSNNLPVSGVQWRRELLHNIQFGDLESHSLVFEGKAVIPRRHFLKIEIVCDYAGDVIIEINYWANPNGSDTTPNELNA